MKYIDDIERWLAAGLYLLPYLGGPGARFKSGGELAEDLARNVTHERY